MRILTVIDRADGAGSLGLVEEEILKVDYERLMLVYFGGGLDAKRYIAVVDPEDDPLNTVPAQVLKEVQ